MRPRKLCKIECHVVRKFYLRPLSLSAEIDLYPTKIKPLTQQTDLMKRSKLLKEEKTSMYKMFSPETTFSLTISKMSASYLSKLSLYKMSNPSKRKNMFNRKDHQLIAEAKFNLLQSLFLAVIN